MTLQELLTRIIDDGIAEVKVAYAHDENFGEARRQGAIEGFESCRNKMPYELVALYNDARDSSADARGKGLPEYWRTRFAELQIEWVCNVVSMGLVNSGMPPLLSHLPTSRGALKYAQIVGTAPDPVVDTTKEDWGADLIARAAKYGQAMIVDDDTARERKHAQDIADDVDAKLQRELEAVVDDWKRSTVPK